MYVKPEFPFLPEKCHLYQKETFRRQMCSILFWFNLFISFIDMKNDDIVKEGNENATQKVTTLHYTYIH